MAGEREHVLAALPGTRSQIAMAFRMNRDNCRSPARSAANQEFHQTDEQASHAARSVAQAMQDAGYRALNPTGRHRTTQDLGTMGRAVRRSRGRPRLNTPTAVRARKALRARTAQPARVGGIASAGPALRRDGERPTCQTVAERAAQTRRVIP